MTSRVEWSWTVSAGTIVTVVTIVVGLAATWARQDAALQVAAKDVAALQVAIKDTSQGVIGLKVEMAGMRAKLEIFETTAAELRGDIKEQQRERSR